jgi:HlyD family secretion protein
MFASVGLFATAGAGVATRSAGTSVRPLVSTSDVTRRNIAVVVQATGTVEAMTTVTVGTQVSGTVQALYADYNSLVRQGQVLARLDPSILTAQVEQAKASVVKAEAEVERLAVSVAGAQATLDRTARLAEKLLIAPSEFEAALVAVRLARAQVRSAEASLTQTRATLRQAEVNLDHTVITSPIDGIVLERSVDAGQTVAASMQAPTLFLLAADLQRMRVNASLDESDVGQVHAGQTVTFMVDAYPGESFPGRVAQVRLQPNVSQNVVTYTTIVDVENPELKLMPGMTATVSIEVARRDNVLTVPAAALRFKPTSAGLAALGGVEPDARGRDGEPLADGQRRATLWRYDGARLASLDVVTGVSDGMTTELVSGPVTEGEPVVTAVTGGSSATRAAAAKLSTTARSPLLGGSMPGPPR